MAKTLLRIAFADDDADDHLLFYKAIKTCYLSPIIDCFFNADAMLDKFRRGNPVPHIIFLDKNMPGNYNYECLAAIKGSGILSAVPVIIYSTSDNAAEIAEADQLGAAHFITKPVRFQDTLTILCNTIHQFVPHELAVRCNTAVSPVCC
ncbi:MAG: response regulator [Chitinophagaceae bacterium]